MPPRRTTPATRVASTSKTAGINQPLTSKSKFAKKTPKTNTDELAAQLASQLHVSKPIATVDKGKQKASGDPRVILMHAVNTASQSLSATIQSGWKANDTTPSGKKTLSGVMTSAEAARKALAELRGISPGDINVERAASSVVGKLIALEIFNKATSMLTEMRAPLAELYGTSAPTQETATPQNLQTNLPPQRPSLELLSLPFPPNLESLSEVVQQLISTYLLYIFSCILSSTQKPDASPLCSILLNNTKPTLLQWLPHIMTLPSKHKESVITRSYTVLIKYTTALPPQTPGLISFTLRAHALHLLIYTPPNAIEPNTFWDQTAKFCLSFVKGSSPGDEDGVTKTVMHIMDELVESVGKREDKDKWMAGRNFVGVLEYWMGFARRVGNISTLNKILTLIEDAGPTSSSASRTLIGSSEIHTLDSPPEMESQPKKGKDTSLEDTKIFAVLTRTTVVLENYAETPIDELKARIEAATATLDRSRLVFNEAEWDKEERVKGKLGRALERLRRAGVRMVEAGGKDGLRNMPMLKAMLEVVVDILAEQINADKISSALDTLFVLGRTSLVPSDHDTYNIAFEYLLRAKELLSVSASASPPPKSDLGAKERANFLRCVSGAFHNIAGTLYRDGKYAAAVRFLKEGCPLGSQALTIHCPDEKGEEEKNDEGWKQLREQLYRRWELLGVCYSKIGDRKLAYDAFIEGVKAFPYMDTCFVQHTRINGIAAVFGSSSSFKQLGTMVDRLTYIGACDLILQPSEVSLKYHLEKSGSHPEIVGALLERQIDSLGGSLWKDGMRVLFKALLLDAVGVYAAGNMPLRRARVLVRCLEFEYKAGNEGIGRHTDALGEEAEELLRCEVLGEDVSLAQFVHQYRATIHIWLGLHAHKREDPQQTTLLAYHTEETCRILRSFVIGAAPLESSPKTKKLSPVKIPSKGPAKTGRGKFRATTTTKLAGTRQSAPGVRSKKDVDPVTPRPTTAFDLCTPRTDKGEAKKPVILFDNYEQFLGLLQLASHLLGLLGLILIKVKLLDVARRLCDMHPPVSRDSYVMLSIDLAHEYVKLGKMAKASTIYGQTLAVVRNNEPTAEIRTLFLLHYSESLALMNNVLRSSTTYCEALGLAESLPVEEKGATTAQKVESRAAILERAAMAARAHGRIRQAKGDLNGFIGSILQSLRLWNRAMDTLARLSPLPTPPQASSQSESNPFEMSLLKNALLSAGSDPQSEPELSPPKKTFSRRLSMDGLEWRICDGLLTSLFDLSRAYFNRGSPRESVYFAEQAQELAESLNVPAMMSRALARKGEVQLHQAKLQDGYGSLMHAAELLQDVLGLDSAEIKRLGGYYNQLKTATQDASQLYKDAIQILEELENLFLGLEGHPPSPRKSMGLSPRHAPAKEIAFSAPLAMILRQHIWMLRDDGGEEYQKLLRRFVDLPPSGETKLEENALRAQLTLHDVYGRFRSDMFLSSLIDSTIVLPMGMTGDKLFSLSPSTEDIVASLDSAEKLFWADLAAVARHGKVTRVRSATISLAVTRALQSSLGRAAKIGPVLTASLLDASAAITLRREMLEAIQQKYPNLQAIDDIQWPLITPNGSPLPRRRTVLRGQIPLADDSDEEIDSDEVSVKRYWENIRDRYHTQSLDITNLSVSQSDRLPENWTVVSINITEDKSTMFITRQAAKKEPLIVCLPLRGRRETEEDEHLSFDDALNELKDIIALSNQGTRQAIHVKNDDPEARAAWWKERIALDKRLQELLENVEFCWLGAFKTILSHPMITPPDILADLRARLDRIFKRSLHSQERKQKIKIRLDENLLCCFSTLSPKCRDEELEDMVYFILDLYQFHGIPVAISEVDVDQVVVDLRTALEEHAVKAKEKVVAQEDSHLFLVLDKNVQGLPWESIPILRGRSVSRIPAMDFLIDRLEFVEWRNKACHRDQDARGVFDRAAVDSRKTYYVLNPSGDLKGTETRFASWLREMHEYGWEGTISRPPSEQQFLNALAKKDLVIYFGHGGGEQYVRSHKIRHLSRCAATMLWGCSSGNLKDMGDFDRVGTPYNYMLAGCPTLVANLWDVTDRDIDKFSQSVFDKLQLNAAGLKRSSRRNDGAISLVTAVAQSRGTCKLKYLTGAAPVVYGIPFYL